jgi:hypothetical protein
MSDDLRPTDHAGVLFALEFSLRPKCRGLIRWARDDELAMRVVAEKLLDHLELANFAIMQKPRLKLHG